MKRGFTLIELLVVVLIIGILAAVALPQYQKAVLKSRYVELVQVIDSLARAQERYYLANGETSPGLENLDITVPLLKLPAFYSLRENGRVLVAFLGTYGDMGLGYVRYATGYGGNCPKQCRAYYKDKREQELCASETGTQNYGTVNNGWTYVYCYDHN